jgi:hypothetical protein
MYLPLDFKMLLNIFMSGCVGVVGSQMPIALFKDQKATMKQVAVGC